MLKLATKKLLPAEKKRLPIIGGLRAGSDTANGSSIDPKDLAFLKQQPPSVIQIVNQVLEDESEDRHYFRPSMIMGCERQNLYWYEKSATNTTQQDPKLRLILDSGTELHRIIQAYLAKHPGFFFAPEAKVWLPDLEVWGSCDGLLFRRKDMYRWGLEIKTTGHEKFMKITKPDPKHIRQASIYARLSGVYWITILYWDRDKQHMKEYHVHYEKSIWDDEIVRRVRRLQGFVKAGAMPTYDEAQCRSSFDFCAFSKQCYRDREKPWPGRVKGGESGLF